MSKRKNEEDKKPKVNPELDGFEIRIDQFGEIKSTYDIDKINQFLNRNVDDKKLRDRDDVENLKDRAQDSIQDAEEDNSPD